jgi:hypothetical protein
MIIQKTAPIIANARPGMLTVMVTVKIWTDGSTPSVDPPALTEKFDELCKTTIPGQADAALVARCVTKLRKKMLAWIDKQSVEDTIIARMTPEINSQVAAIDVST